MSQTDTSFWLWFLSCWSYCQSALQDKAADQLKEVDEEDTLEIITQTSPIVQVFYLSARSCSQLHWCLLTYVPFLSDSTSALQTSQDSFFISSGNIAIFFSQFNLISDLILSSSKHQSAHKNCQSLHKMLPLILASQHRYLHVLLRQILMKPFWNK